MAPKRDLQEIRRIVERKVLEERKERQAHLARIAQLEAENERLRKALEAIVERPRGGTGDEGRSIARAALEGDERGA